MYEVARFVFLQDQDPCLIISLFDRDIFFLVQWNKIAKIPTWIPMSTPIPGSPQLSTIDTNYLSTELVAFLLDATPRISISVPNGCQDS
jgi:hypothetical protein